MARAFLFLSALLLLGCSASQQATTPSATAVATAIAAATPVPSATVAPATPSPSASLAVKTREDAIYYTRRDIRVVSWLNAYTGASRENPEVTYEKPNWIVKYTDSTCVDIRPDRSICTMTATVDEVTGRIVTAAQK